jgi:hypothetical protein
MKSRARRCEAGPGMPAEASLKTGDRAVVSYPFSNPSAISSAERFARSEARLGSDWFQSLGLSAIKFGVPRPGSITFEGLAKIYPMSLANNDSAFGSVVWIMREKILGDIAAYTTSMPSIICRGLWAGGGVIALFGMFHVRRMLAYARPDQRITDHFVVLVPIVTLFIGNTLFTSNAYWLNPLLPFVYSYAIAYVASGF